MACLNFGAFLSVTSVKLTNVLTSKVTRLSLDSDFFLQPLLTASLVLLGFCSFGRRHGLVEFFPFSLTGGVLLIMICFVLLLECLTSFLELVVAGIAGSPHMISATVISVARVVYEFRSKCGDTVEPLLWDTY